MTNSKPHFVINGYSENDKSLPGFSKILTAAGESLLVESSKIVKSFPVEASSEKGLCRIFVEDGANIWLGVTGEILQKLNPSVPNIGDSTILKWMDDGGTISKSRDDNFTVGTQL